MLLVKRMWVETFQPASVRSNADDEVLPGVVSRLVVFVFSCCLTSSYIHSDTYCTISFTRLVACAC